MKIEVLRPSELTDAQIARWSQLQTADAALDSPFLSPYWVLAVERANLKANGVDGGIRVAVLRRDGEDQASGFFAARAGAFTAMPAGAPMSDYQAVVAEKGLEIDPKALVKALGVGRLDFTHVLAEQTAFAPHMHGRERSWIIDIAGGYGEYERLTRERSSVLKDIDKKRRKAEREVGPSRFCAMSRARGDFTALIQLKRAQMKATGQTDVLGVGWTAALVEDLFERRDADFGGALFTLHLGDRLAAMHFHLYSGGAVHGWLIAHTPEFERYSPGLMLFQDILKWMDGGPYHRLDLGCGDYRFKRELSNLQQETGHGFVGTASPATLARTVAYGLRDAAESLPLGRVSALPGKAMRRLDVLRALR